jgi:hypothetical protein
MCEIEAMIRRLQRGLATLHEAHPVPLSTVARLPLIRFSRSNRKELICGEFEIFHAVRCGNPKITLNYTCLSAICTV